MLLKKLYNGNRVDIVVNITITQIIYKGKGTLWIIPQLDQHLIIIIYTTWVQIKPKVELNLKDSNPNLFWLNKYNRIDRSLMNNE